jgi:hypothetical protein
MDQHDLQAKQLAKSINDMLGERHDLAVVADAFIQLLAGVCKQTPDPAAAYEAFIEFLAEDVGLSEGDCECAECKSRCFLH